MADPNHLPEQRLGNGIAVLGLSLPANANAQLMAYQAELLKWNAAYNLTAIRYPDEMVIRHLLDSLALLPVLDERMPATAPDLLDVGAGPGLPCIPLAIARPDWTVRGLDSNGKKVRFMRHAQRTLALANFGVIESRVDELPPDEGYAVITSRAFASLGEFFRQTQHLLRADGVWVAMKGKLEADELAQVPATVEILETRKLKVPGLHEERHAVIARPKP